MYAWRLHHHESWSSILINQSLFYPFIHLYIYIYREREREIYLYETRKDKAKLAEKYMWKRNMYEIFLHFFLRKFWASSYILDLAKTVCALRILPQKFNGNFGIKELWALENHVLVNMLLWSCKYTSVHSSKLLAYLFHDFFHISISISIYLSLSLYIYIYIYTYTYGQTPDKHQLYQLSHGK